MDNNVIFNKAALAVQDLASGGYLNPMQSERFIRGIIDQPTILKKCRTVTIDGEQKKIEKIGFGQRIMRPGVENTPLNAEDYAKPQFGKIELSTKETIAEVRISYDTLEANIEGDRLRNTIITLIQERCALDLEELILQGDKNHPSDTYLQILDGVLKKQESKPALLTTDQWNAVNKHIVDAQGNEPSLTLWTQLIKAVPAKYIRDMAAWRIFTSRNVDLAWKNAIASRNTVAGDRFLLQNTNATALGFEIEPIAMMPENLTYGTTPVQTNLGQALLTHPQNIVVGFTRRVQMEYDKDISARQFIIVVTLKCDVAIEETDAMAKLINIKPSFTPAE
jgi:hypothetical protein